MKCEQMWLYLGIFCLILGLATPVMGESEETGPEKADVRILIDISGSMKENDPRNLRRSALRLLVGILPDNTRAGVWTFGQYVNMEIPLGTVDKAWKKRARVGAGRIHSRGLFTNIEAVLKRANEDWGGVSRDYRRHLVLLTDGMVDISKDPSENTASRRRILDQVVPRLKGLGAKLHTIALSKRADQKLMRQLAEATGGWYEQVDSAERLQRVFLRIFEKVGKPDTLPLKDNRFTVDESVRELTLLVFQPEPAQPTRIQTPGGETFDAETAPESVTWHRDEGYDLLTIVRPESGTWLVQAKEDPDNRVMVVTDLRMKVSDLPNRAVLGQKIPVIASFADHGRHIERREFLGVLRVNSEQRTEQTMTEPQPLFDDGHAPDQTAGDGYFTQTIGESFQSGVSEFVVTTRGKTFMRERRQTLEIVSPVVLDVTAKPGDPIAEVSLRPVAGAIDPATVRSTAELTGSDGQSRSVDLQKGEDDIWRARLDLGSLEGNLSLRVALTGSTPEGQELDLTLDPITLQGQAQNAGEEPEPAAEVPAAAPDVQAQSETVVEETTENGWMFQAILFGTGNLLLTLFGGAVFWFVRRRQVGDDIQLLEDGEAAV
jgi:uncharacterized protein (TIGR03503 family)